MHLLRTFLLTAVLCGLALSSIDLTQADPGVPAAPSTIYLPLLVGRPGGQTPAERAMAEQVLSLVNAERARAGCGPLALDPRLVEAAQGHSRDMAINNYFSHTGLDGSRPSQRASRAGYTSSFLGENIAAGYPTAQAVVAGWMDSDGHRANMLNCRYTQTGIGYVYQADDQPLADAGWPYFHYWTQLFGTPR